MKKVLLALWALSALGAFAETYSKGYVYPIGPDFHYFDNDEELASMNENWPVDMMKNGGCSFGETGVRPYGTAAVWFMNQHPLTVAEADELCPVVADPWIEGAYALKMQATAWWGFGNFNFALPKTDEPCRVRAIFRCDVNGANAERWDNDRGILFRITNDYVESGDDGYPGPNAKVEIPDIWTHPDLYRVVDLYTSQLDGQAYFAITFMPGGFSCGGSQPAFYLEEVSIIPTRLIVGDTHKAGQAEVKAVAERPALTVLEDKVPEELDYYVFKAGRGTPYLAFSQDYLSETSNVRLYRTSSLTQNNIWAVTAGPKEGSVTVTAYGTNRGLMRFKSGDNISYGSGSVADVSRPQPIYMVHNDNGTVSFCLNNAEGTASINGYTEYYALDATNNSHYCGNWIPNDVGTSWSAYKLDLSKGIETALEEVEAAIKEDEIKAATQAMVNEYVGYLNSYINTVPWVANELQAGIDALNAVESTEDYESRITEIWNSTCANANGVLSTVFNGKVVVLENLRRAATGVSPYVGTNATLARYYGVDTLDDYSGHFTMTSSGEEGGYILYNKATKTYIGASGSPVADKDAAQVVYPVLHNHDGYAGVAMPQSPQKSGPGLNFQSWENGSVSYWSINDAGSVWSLIEVEDSDIMQDILDAYVPELEAYMPALTDKIAEILGAAANKIKALTYSMQVVDEAKKIYSDAIAAANMLLAEGLNGERMTLKNLRQNKFLSVADNEWVYTENNNSYPTVFTFKAKENGGYLLYNEAANVYVGKTESDGAGQTNVLPAADESSAMTIYPFLSKSDMFAGVALAVEVDPTAAATALNTNNDSKILHTYRADDDGSIFALVEPKVSGLNLNGIVAKVGESIEISATVEPENASDNYIAWSSSDPRVATVDSDGRVWFQTAGNAVVTAKCQGFEVNVPFVVEEVIANSLHVFPVEVVGAIGHQFSLLAIYEPENTTDKSVMWTSSNPDVAAVSADGRVELIALGSAEITAAKGELTAVCSITVDDVESLTEVAIGGAVISIVDDGIIVSNVNKGESIAVYSIDGKVVNGAIVESDETKLNLAAGIYIVKISPSTVAKILLK